MIDFADPRNLIFFAIVLIFAAIIIAIFFIILRTIFRVIKNIFRKLFGRREKEDKTSAEEKEKPIAYAPPPQAQSPMPQNIRQEKNFSLLQKENTPAEQTGRGANKDVEQKSADAKQAFEEKNKKDIEGELAKLKTSGSAGDQTLESKMLSREIKIEEESVAPAKIEIPKAPKFRTEKQPSNILPQVSAEIPAEDKNIDDYLEKPDILETKNLEEKNNQNSKQNPLKKPGDAPSQDISIFGGKGEISRADLRQKLRKDPKVWSAQRQAGLNLSPTERAKLEKQVFSSALGRNISKSDLKASVRKLGQKMLSEKNPQEHAKIRKEIKFFKKIGGI